MITRPFNRLVPVLLLSLLVCAGCTSTRRQLVISSDDPFAVGPKEFVLIQGPNDKTWFSGHQLIGLAMRYAEDQKLEFEFEGTEKIVWVRPGGRIRADVRFSSGMGKPVLRVAIDKYGKVVRHDTGTAVCGTGRK